MVRRKLSTINQKYSVSYNGEDLNEVIKWWDYYSNNCDSIRYENVYSWEQALRKLAEFVDGVQFWSYGISLTHYGYFPKIEFEKFQSVISAFESHLNSQETIKVEFWKSSSNGTGIYLDKKGNRIHTYYCNSDYSEPKYIDQPDLKSAFDWLVDNS